MEIATHNLEARLKRQAMRRMKRGLFYAGLILAVILLAMVIGIAEAYFKSLPIY